MTDKSLNHLPHKIVIPEASILGRMNCNRCGHWRYLHEFPNHRRMLAHEVHIYIRGICRVCESKRVKGWRGKFDPEDWKKKNKEYYLSRRERARRMPVWPLRRWVILKLAAGGNFETLAWTMNVSPGVVKDIYRGYRVDSVGQPYELKWIEREMLEYIFTAIKENEQPRKTRASSGRGRIPVGHQ